MKRSSAIIPALGIFIVLLSSVALPVDDPGTPYDESEAPINIAIPVVSTVARARIVFHVNRPSVLRGQQMGPDNYAMTRTTSADRLSTFRRELFSTLRC